MPADVTEPDFMRYLTCDIPLGYPLKTPITKLLSPTLTSASRRELLHQQAHFIERGKMLVATHPWLSYLAVLKHEAVLVAIPTYASQLVDIVDVNFFTEVQQKARELRESARAAIDETTAQYCERLVLLQGEAAQIESATKSVKGALAAGFTAVEPLPNPPKEPEPGLRKLTTYIGAALACLLISAFFPWSYITLACGLAVAAGVGLAGWREIKKDQAIEAAETATFRAYLHHENYHSLCKKSVSLVLALPFEIRKSALVDLAPCLTALEALPGERVALEAAYITPFFPS